MYLTGLTYININLLVYLGICIIINYEHTFNYINFFTHICFKPLICTLQNKKFI